MNNLAGQFIDGQSYRRCEHEQEGFARALNLEPGQVPTCGSHFSGNGTNLADFRGTVPALDGSFSTYWLPVPAYLDRRSVEWETSPASSAVDTVFTWIGGSQVRPVRPSYPYVTATLEIDGEHRLRFPLGWTSAYTVKVDGFLLAFEPRRFLSLVESSHRTWDAHGVSGFYRVEVPGKYLVAGRVVKLKVTVDDAPPECRSIFYVSPRSDALSLSLATLRDQVARLQADMTQLKVSHEMLYAQMYPDLFPRRIKAERIIVVQDELLHYHPATLTVLRSGEVIITSREGADHLSPDGKMVFFRSRDGGRTWGPREVLFDLGDSDHRSSPLFELPDGQWLATDYRAKGQYNAKGEWDLEHMTEPNLWGAWSTDQGKSWQFTDQPLTVPGQHAYAEAERHMIQLPSGRLLVAANYMPLGPDGVHAVVHAYGVAIFCSDDQGRHWRVLSHLPEAPFRIMGECTMLPTRDGKVLLLARSQPANGSDFTQRGPVVQSVSSDGGETWSKPAPTGMSSMNSPAHLIHLHDGRILCSHASRHYPGSIYITLSHDQGKTWDTRGTRILANDIPGFDSCYPTSGQLADGTILTTWYSNLFGKFFIAVMRYSPSDL